MTGARPQSQLIASLAQNKSCTAHPEYFIQQTKGKFTLFSSQSNPHCLSYPQGIASDIVRYFAFFSYFTIQLAQLFLCCFADQPPEGKNVLEKVGTEVFRKKMHGQLSCGFQLLSSRDFSLLEGNDVIPLLSLFPVPIPLQPVLASWNGSVNVSVFYTAIVCMPSA